MYTKNNSRELKITEQKNEVKIISYDKILNDIQMYEEKLVELRKLKIEADKLNLIR